MLDRRVLLLILEASMQKRSMQHQIMKLTIDVHDTDVVLDWVTIYFYENRPDYMKYIIFI